MYMLYPKSWSRELTVTGGTSFTRLISVSTHLSVAYTTYSTQYLYKYGINLIVKLD